MANLGGIPSSSILSYVRFTLQPDLETFGFMGTLFVAYSSEEAVTQS